MLLLILAAFLIAYVIVLTLDEALPEFREAKRLSAQAQARAWQEFS